MKERDENAIPISSGYEIHLYCCVCKEHGGVEDRGYKPMDIVTSDGHNAYSIARRKARRMGWVLHNDGYATCPKCR